MYIYRLGGWIHGVLQLPSSSGGIPGELLVVEYMNVVHSVLQFILYIIINNNNTEFIERYF